jgi:beta-galactosidase
MDRRDFLGTLLTGSAVPAWSDLASAEGAQRPAPFAGDDTPRVRRNFNDGWLFARQTKGTGELGSFDRTNGEAAQVQPRFREAHRFDYDDGDWQAVELPHTWNAHDVTDATPGYWRGIGWYRKRFKLDPAESQKRVFLEFEGVNSFSEFWLNGERIGEHRGGYTSFEYDVTDQVRLDAAGNVLAVKVDNLYHPTVPPTVKTDYNFYGGIYRDVWLRLSEPTYISIVTWKTPAVSAESAEFSLEADIINKTSEAHDLTLTHEILDPDGELACSLSSTVHLPAGAMVKAESRGAVKFPRLWSPDSPSIYQIRTTLRSEDEVADRVETPLGFRWFKFDPQQGFLLNGRRVQIQGTNWHQCYPGMGSALPNSRHRKDMEMIREMGVNFWRTSHYPHDPATIEASDHLGLMVWEELPVNKEIGNPDEYIANVLAMAEEMIRRDRNNPSVMVWGIAGEINAPLAVSKRVVEAVARKYRQLDSTRSVAMHSPGSDEIEALVDVVGLGVGDETDEKHRRYPRRSYMTAEYAAATMGRGLYGMRSESEDLACEKHEAYLRPLYARPWMAGGMIWHQFDYDGETYDTVIPHIVAFGMADAWRIPKDVFYFYQSQWSAAPMVHIAAHWTWPGYEGQSKRVKVYSNAEEVELLLNGKSLGAKTEMSGSGLPHSPRVWDIAYAPGTLTAIARGQGKELRDERKTAGPPHHLLLESDAAELRSGDRESLAYLTAMVVDEQGTVVPTATHPITFTSYGPGELLEQTWLGHGTGLTWNAVAGKTRVAFRATSRTGHAVVSAYSPGLVMGRVELNVSAPGQPNEMDYRDRPEPDEP